MVAISRLYCGKVEESERLRFRKETPSWKGIPHVPRPILVWNMTSRCNLRCTHCYAHAGSTASADELSTQEARALIDDCADFGVPYLLFSGGEPLMRPDLVELIAYAAQKGVRPGLSTNGTLIDPERGVKLKEAGLTYAGISIDGLKENHDAMRQAEGAFELSCEGARNCIEAGIKTGFRYTLTAQNYGDIPGIFDLLREKNIHRICFYHLVYSGRGKEIQKYDTTLKQKREILDTIIDHTAKEHKAGNKIEVLSVDNHCDGIFLYKRMLREKSPQAPAVLSLLEGQGASGTGIGIGCVSWDGTVYPDQFWRNHPLGTIRERPFSSIWSDPEISLLKQLRNKKELVKGRCADCAYLDICGGNFRARAEGAYGDMWAQEPACYLTDEEIHTRP